MKLVTVNIEYDRHYETVLPFLDREQADCICLQEAPESFQIELAHRGYHTSFAPMLQQNLATGIATAGVLIATKTPHEASTHYFYRAAQNIVLESETDRAGTISQPVLRAQFSGHGIEHSIATLHLVKTDNGHADTHQTHVVTELLEHLRTQPPHLLVGDFNMPRGHNTNYDRFGELYTDEIPQHYTSSLDKSLYKKAHADGSPIDQHIFTDYMVDYIFSQPPYQVSDVRLQFGVSDHAALVCSVKKGD